MAWTGRPTKDNQSRILRIDISDTSYHSNDNRNAWVEGCW